MTTIVTAPEVTVRAKMKIIIIEDADQATLEDHGRRGYDVWHIARTDLSATVRT